MGAAKIIFGTAVVFLIALAVLAIGREVGKVGDRIALAACTSRGDCPETGSAVD